MLPDDLADRVRAYLDRGGGKGNRSYLLTGLVVCERCGRIMRSRAQQGHKLRYVCTTDATPLACRSTAILARPLEAWVGEQLLAHIERHFDDVTILLAGVGDELRDRWNQLPLGKQEALVRTAVSSVSVGAARPGVHTFESGRVTLRWCDDAV